MNEITAVVEYDNSLTVSSVGVQGLSATDLNLTSFSDVDASDLGNGSILVYKASTNKWTSTTTLDAQNMEGGEF